LPHRGSTHERSASARRPPQSRNAPAPAFDSGALARHPACHAGLPPRHRSNPTASRPGSRSRGCRLRRQGGGLADAARFEPGHTGRPQPTRQFSAAAAPRYTRVTAGRRGRDKISYPAGAALGNALSSEMSATQRNSATMWSPRQWRRRRRK